MKKFTTLILSFILVFSFIFTLSSLTGCSPEPEEEIGDEFTRGDIPFEEWQFNFSLAGDSYSIPFTFSEALENGWELPPETDNMIETGATGTKLLYKDDFLFSWNILNPGFEHPIPLGDGLVTNITVASHLESNATFIIEDSLRLGVSTVEEFIEVFGLPSTIGITSEGDSTVYHYNYWIEDPWGKGGFIMFVTDSPEHSMDAVVHNISVNFFEWQNQSL